MITRTKLQEAIQKTIEILDNAIKDYQHIEWNADKTTTPEEEYETCATIRLLHKVEFAKVILMHE